MSAAALLLLASVAGPARAASLVTCGSTVVSSCTSAANASSVSSCCVNKPGGQFLQTQFWDTDPVTDPANSWTIHGLWPDNCDGTYAEDCDPARAYTDIAAILTEFNKTDVLAFMDAYWNSDSETNEAFWEHEWSTHGTCVSTLDPACYADYTTGEEAADYFQVTVDLFQTLDTYAALASAGIVPSSGTTYTSAAILGALEDITNIAPVIRCSSGKLSQVYYGFAVDGPLQDGAFMPAAVVGNSSNCSSAGVSYLPKTGATTTVGVTGTATATTTTAAASSPTSTGSFAGKGYLNVYYDGAQDGCLISYGTWYTTGTCATYTATTSGSGFTLMSSKGSCGIVSGALSCGSSVNASTFTVVDGLLEYDGQTTFYATVVPTGSTQATIYTSSQTYKVMFGWESI